MTTSHVFLDSGGLITAPHNGGGQNSSAQPRQQVISLLTAIISWRESLLVNFDRPVVNLRISYAFHFCSATAIAIHRLPLLTVYTQQPAEHISNTLRTEDRRGSKCREHHQSPIKDNPPWEPEVSAADVQMPQVDISTTSMYIYNIREVISKLCLTVSDWPSSTCNSQYSSLY